MQYYKVWGDEFQFSDYSEERDDKGDWSGYYFQHNIKHSLTYVNKKYDDGYELVSLVEMKLRNPDIKVVRLEDPVYGDGRVSGAEKAQRAKKYITAQLGITFGGLKLMQMLGQQGMMLELLDADEYELVVPHRLFNNTNFEVHTIGQFKRHPTEKYLTAFYRAKDCPTWTACKGSQRYQPYLLSDRFSSK